MAAEFTRETGRKLVGCMVFCLRSNGARRLFGWFDLSETDKEALLAILRSLFDENLELDMAGLRKMLEAFMSMTDPGSMEDRNRTTWSAVADGINNIPTLTPDETGRRIWYESLTDEGDAEWNEGEAAPDEQYFLTKLRKVGKSALKHLKLLEDRWKKGEAMLELYKSFMTIANTRGPGQTILNLQLKVAKIEDVVKDIKQGNQDANKWATEISAYFNVTIAGNFLDAMKFFFPGAGYEVEPKIDWGKLRERLEEKDINALKLTSTEIKPANEMEEVNSTLKVLGETMLRVNNLGEEPIETEKEKKENKRKKDVRDGFKEKCERWYQTLVADFMEGEEIRKLTATKTQLIKYGEIVKSLGGTWADIRNFDSDFMEVRKLKYKIGEEELEVDTEDGLIEMSERIREAEEKLKEERKAKEDLQKQDVKRSEAMMKKENIVTYEGKASFLEWAGTITKLLEQLPESTADVIICSFVKTTINHKETFNLIQNCKETQDIMKIMGELHATDKSVVIEAFAPIKQLKKPTTFSIAFHNGQVILRTADTLASIGIEEAIELNELDLCVDKAIHDGRYQAWLEYSHLELKKLAEMDKLEHPEEKTKLEEKGKYDITHSIQNFNKGRSLARNFHLLCKWIKEDMSLVQDAKDREERTNARTHVNPKGGGGSTASYFVQQNSENQSRFNVNRGMKQGPGGYKKPYGTNGGVPQGQRPQGVPQGRPNRHPDCQIALERWRTLKGVGMEAKPMTKDCPLKCSHAIPFGNAGWCTTFRKYEPSMKLDVVKKNGLCRRCLSNWGPPHSPKDCRAPPCSKCKGDHHMLICPAPSGSVQVHATGFIDIYKDKDVFDDLEQQIMMLTTHTGEERIYTGGEDHVGQYYMGEAVVEEYMEDDIVFEDLDEPVNHFCINFIEDTPQAREIEAWSLSPGMSVNNMVTEETVAEEERIGSKGAMGELKSDDTKPTEQKVGGGHLMTEADSLRTNADSKADTITGYENTEGSQFCKVNTIRQADQNSEALWTGKPLQETGRKDWARGILESQRHSEMDPKIINKGKHVWGMTCREDMVETAISKESEKPSRVCRTKAKDWAKEEVGDGNHKEEEGRTYQMQEAKDEESWAPLVSLSRKNAQVKNGETHGTERNPKAIVEESSKERKKFPSLQGCYAESKKDKTRMYEDESTMGTTKVVEDKKMEIEVYKPNQDGIIVGGRASDGDEENVGTDHIKPSEATTSEMLNGNQTKPNDWSGVKTHTTKCLTEENTEIVQSMETNKEQLYEEAWVIPGREAIIFSTIGPNGQRYSDQVGMVIGHLGYTEKKIQLSSILQQDYKQTTYWDWIVDQDNSNTHRKGPASEKRKGPAHGRDQNKSLRNIGLQWTGVQGADTENISDDLGRNLMTGVDECNVHGASAQHQEEVESRARSATTTADQDYAKMTQDKQVKTTLGDNEHTCKYDSDNEGGQVSEGEEMDDEKTHRNESIASTPHEMGSKELKSNRMKSPTGKQQETRNKMSVQGGIGINTQEEPLGIVLKVQWTSMIPQRCWEELTKATRWKIRGDLTQNWMYNNLTLNRIGKSIACNNMHENEGGLRVLAIPFGESPIDISSILARHQIELSKAVTSDFAVALSARGLIGRVTCRYNTQKHSKVGFNKKDNISTDEKTWVISVPAGDEMHPDREREENTSQAETGDIATAETKKEPQQRTKEAAENHLLEAIGNSAKPTEQNETNKTTSKEVKEQKDKVKGRLEEEKVKQSRKKSKLEDKHSTRWERDEELKDYGKRADGCNYNTNKVTAEWNRVQECTEIGSLDEIYLTVMKAAEAGKARITGKREWLEEEHYQSATKCGQGTDGKGWKTESSSKEIQLEEVKENMAKETTNGVEHEKNQREVCGQDRNQKDQIVNEATETTGPEIEREPGKRKEAVVLATHCRRENNGSKFIKEQTDIKSGKRSDKESDKDPEKNENEEKTGQNDVQGGLCHR